MSGLALLVFVSGHEGFILSPMCNFCLRVRVDLDLVTLRVKNCFMVEVIASNPLCGTKNLSKSFNFNPPGGRRTNSFGLCDEIPQSV